VGVAAGPPHGGVLGVGAEDLEHGVLGPHGLLLRGGGRGGPGLAEVHLFRRPGLHSPSHYRLRGGGLPDHLPGLQMADLEVLQGKSQRTGSTSTRRPC